MNDTLINNYNSVINDNDIVFILGDFCFDQRSQWVKFLNKLHGKKYFIIGNHDRLNAIPNEMFEAVADIIQLFIWNHDNEKDIDNKNPMAGCYDKLILCHYPILSYPGMFNHFVHLYGHVHTRENNTGLDAHLLQYLVHSYDVGVDNNNFYPVSIEQIRKIFGVKHLYHENYK